MTVAFRDVAAHSTMFVLDTQLLEASDGSRRVEAERGMLAVPERRDDPGSRAIHLVFWRLRARTANPGPPVVLLVGGPGGSGSNTLAARLDALIPFTELADLIVLDQRGCGQSTPFTCASHVRVNLPLDRPGHREEDLAHYLDRCRESRQWWEATGADLSGYTTNENADDVNDLRQALGYEKIRLLGLSYGSHLGLSVIRRHGEHVASAILGLVEGPDHTVKLPGQTQAALGRISELAAAAPELKGKVRDLTAMLVDLVQRLDRSPASVEIGSTGVTLGGHDVAWPVALMMGRTEVVAALPQAIHAGLKGDLGFFARWSANNRTAWLLGPLTHVMDAASGASSDRWKRVEAEAPATILGDLANFPVAYAGVAWGAPDLGDEFRSPVISDVPTLLVSGTLDANTPPANAVEVLNGLQRGAHLVVENMAHDYFFTFPEVLPVLIDWFRRQTLSSERVVRPIQFRGID